MTDHQTTDDSAAIKSETLDSLRNGVEAVVTGSFLFRSLEPASRNDLADRGVVMVFPSAKVVLTEGDPSSDFYLIDQSVVEVTTATSDGAPVVLATLQHGAFFGEVALLKGLPRTATVTALTISGTTSLSAVGQTSQLTLMATLSSGAPQTVTSQATWQSTNTAVATVSAAGRVTAQGYGGATIRASYQGTTTEVALVVTIAGTWVATGPDGSRITWVLAQSQGIVTGTPNAMWAIVASFWVGSVPSTSIVGSASSKPLHCASLRASA